MYAYVYIYIYIYICTDVYHDVYLQKITHYRPEFFGFPFRTVSNNFTINGTLEVLQC